jgi:hypothetical protein
LRFYARTFLLSKKLRWKKSKRQAHIICRHIILTEHHTSISDISSVSYITRQRKPAIYEVLFQNGNTILLSGSKACIPVLGCNFSGKGETVVNNNDLPFGLQDMLDGMLMDIDSALLNDTITLYHQAEFLQENPLHIRRSIGLF